MRCKVLLEDGLRCPNRAATGVSRCWTHVEQDETSLRVLYHKLISAVGPAVATLVEATGVNCEAGEQGGCRLHGLSGCPDWTARVKASVALLDRAGLGPTATLKLPSDTDRSPLEASPEELTQRVERLRVAIARVNTHATEAGSTTIQ
jgi:hypothetical protein